MPRVLVRAIRPRKDFPNWEKAKRVLEAALENEVKPIVLPEFEKRVANWRRKPDFGSRKIVTPDQMILYVFPQGPYKMQWKWVSQGVKRHPITARRAPYLKYRKGYISKTTPEGGYGGSGDYTGETRRAYSVPHPGIKAREFEKDIAEDLKSEFSRIMKNAMARAKRVM